MLISQPEKVGGALRCGHQPHLRGMHPAQSIAIDDGEDLSWMSVEGLANEPCHAGEGHAVHGNGLVLGCHPRASRLGEWLDQKTGVIGVLQRRPRPVGIEKAVEGRGGVGRVKERRTHNQYGQQEVRKFGEVRLHGPDRRHGSRGWAPQVDIGERDG